MIEPYYQHNGITIYHGDCLEVMPHLEPVDLVLTDPPYGVEFTGKVNKDIKHTNGYANKIGDDLVFFKNVVIEIINGAISKHKRVVSFMSNKNLMEMPKPNDIGCFYVQFGGRVGPWGFGSVNLVLFYGKDPFLSRGMGSRPNSWFVNETAPKNGHPCPKPIGWMKKLVIRCSFPGEIIIDPFMGSGTTLVAAKELNRKAIGIEIEEKYCEIAVRRLSQEVFDFKSMEGEK